jgi:secondary thiamine-phosphate synthase enzyme
MFRQFTIKLSPKRRGFHLITQEVLKQLDISTISVGLATFFLQHTSASLTLNENCDSSVRKDMEMMLNLMISEDTQFEHDAEGPDDMPAHVKSSLFGVSITVPITNGKLNLGTWQVNMNSSVGNLAGRTQKQSFISTYFSDSGRNLEYNHHLHPN